MMERRGSKAELNPEESVLLMIFLNVLSPFGRFLFLILDGFE